MRKITLLTLITLVSSLFTFKTFAQDEATEAPDKGELTISGYVDVYYQYNLNKPPQNTGLIAGENAGRIFDIKHNEFALGLAQTKFAYTKGKLTGVVDLTFGPNAELGNFGNAGTAFAIKQAYLDYNFTDKLKFTAGQFGTHVGYELIDAPLNFNYSLSYLFGNGPFYHTGAKLSYAVSDKFGLMAGVVNGWDALFDFNDKKSFIGQVYVAPVDGFSLYLNYVGGDEQNGLSFPTIAAVDSASTTSHIFDITTAYQVSDKFKIGLNGAYGTGKLLFDSTATANSNEETYSSASWFGVALYLNYNVSDKFGIGLRAEHFNDEDGVRYISSSAGTGVAAAYNEFTLTGNIVLEDGKFLIKPEIRIDVAGEDAFNKYDSDGNVDEVTNTQTTIGAAFIYSF